MPPPSKRRRTDASHHDPQQNEEDISSSSLRNEPSRNEETYSGPGTVGFAARTGGHGGGAAIFPPNVNSSCLIHPTPPANLALLPPAIDPAATYYSLQTPNLPWPYSSSLRSTLAPYWPPLYPNPLESAAQLQLLNLARTADPTNALLEAHQQARQRAIRNPQRSSFHRMPTTSAADASEGVASNPLWRQEQSDETVGHEEQEDRSIKVGPSPPRHQAKFKRESWEAMFDKLVLYKQKHGTCVVPQEYKDIPKLGNWVQKQRTLKKTGRLDPHREERLNSIDFVWRIQEPWTTMFESLKKYKDKFDHTKVPKHYEDDPKLAKWIRVQRMRKKSLSQDRLELLNSIGFFE